MIQVARSHIADDARPREVWQNADPDLLTTLAEEIASLSAHLHAETRRLLALIAEFDRLEGWKREGFSSCAEWLAYRTRLDKATAREKVRVARALAGLPEIDATMGRGDLSFSQVRALTRVADIENESELLEHARALSAAGLERLVRSWKRLGRADEAPAEERRHASRCLSVFPDEDGSYVIRGRLDPEVGALLMRAIEAAQDAEYRGSVPELTPEQRRADAIGLLAERALAAGFGDREADAGGRSGGEENQASDTTESVARGVRADRYLVVLHTDPATLAEMPERSHLEDGTRVSAETSRRLACDAAVVRIRGAEGESDDGGAAEIEGRTRVVPPRMRRALQLRDHGCRFPGCGSRFTDAHHIQHWADGGATRLENLVLLCRTHHRLLHEGGFRIEPDPKRAGGAVFFAPTGVRIPETPPPMRWNGRSIGVDSGTDGATHRTARWEDDVPLALYLAAMASVGLAGGLGGGSRSPRSRDDGRRRSEVDGCRGPETTWPRVPLDHHSFSGRGHVRSMSNVIPRLNGPRGPLFDRARARRGRHGGRLDDQRFVMESNS